MQKPAASNPATPLLFDSGRISKTFARSIAINDPEAGFLVQRAAETISERLLVTNREFDTAADLWSKFSAMKIALQDCGNVKNILQVLQDSHDAGPHGAADIVAELEALPLEPASVSLITSVFALHRCNNLPLMLKEILTALKPDGLFTACLPGAQTLGELRECLLAAESELTGNATMRVEPFGEVRQFGDLLQRAGFALPVVDSDLLTVRYRSFSSLIRDLRAMGATSALANGRQTFAGRNLFKLTEEIYRERYSDADGKIRVSVELVYLSGWAPHASQQKPAKRGSASHALKDFL